MIKNKIVVGILHTYNLTKEDNNPYDDRATFVRMYEEMITKNGAIAIGLLNNNIGIYKDICDAYIWPGGSYIQKDFYIIFDDVIKNHKPLLGICLGFQAICTYFNILEDQKNENNLSIIETYNKNKETNPYLIRLDENELKIHSNYVTKDKESIEKAKHKIIINKNTFMYDIYKKEAIKVPSMHGFKPPRLSKELIISAIAEDNIVEAVEYHKNNSKILGVHYHPELIKDNAIFKWLIDNAKDNQKKNQN